MYYVCRGIGGIHKKLNLLPCLSIFSPFCSWLSANIASYSCCTSSIICSRYYIFSATCYLFLVDFAISLHMDYLLLCRPYHGTMRTVQSDKHTHPDKQRSKIHYHYTYQRVTRMGAEDTQLEKERNKTNNHEQKTNKLCTVWVYLFFVKNTGEKFNNSSSSLPYLLTFWHTIYTWQTPNPLSTNNLQAFFYSAPISSQYCSIILYYVIVASVILFRDLCVVCGGGQVNRWIMGVVGRKRKRLNITPMLYCIT